MFSLCFFRFFLFHQSWFFPFLFFIICTGADVNKESAPPGVFRYPSYVQDIMGYDSWWIIINTKDYSQNLRNGNIIGNSSSLVACKRDPSKTQFFKSVLIDSCSLVIFLREWCTGDWYASIFKSSSFSSLVHVPYMNNLFPSFLSILRYVIVLFFGS